MVDKRERERTRKLLQFIVHATSLIRCGFGVGFEYKGNRYLSKLFCCWLVQLFLVVLFCCWHSFFLSKVLSFYFSVGVCAFFVVCGYYLSKGPKLHTNGVHKYEMANYVAASKSVGGSQGTIYICRLLVRYI